MSCNSQPTGADGVVPSGKHTFKISMMPTQQLVVDPALIKTGWKFEDELRA